MRMEARIRALAEARLAHHLARAAELAAGFSPEVTVTASEHGITLAGRGLRWRSVVDPELREQVRAICAGDA